MTSPSLWATDEPVPACRRNSLIDTPRSRATYPRGKLPQADLVSLLNRALPHPSRVIFGPGLGRDAAVIDFGDRYLRWTGVLCTLFCSQAFHAHAQDVKEIIPQSCSEVFNLFTAAEKDPREWLHTGSRGTAFREGLEPADYSTPALRTRSGAWRFRPNVPSTQGTRQKSPSFSTARFEAALNDYRPAVSSG